MPCFRDHFKYELKATQKQKGSIVRLLNRLRTISVVNKF